MVEEKHKADDNPALALLQRKSDEGVINIVGGVLADPKVQVLIKKSVLKETFTSGCLMACFIVGLMMLFNVAKTVFGFNWIGDLIASLALISVGAGYMLRNILSNR